MSQQIVLAIFAILSTVHGQTLNCQTSSTIGGTARGAACVFPFEYEGTTYNECTTANYGNTFWCGTTSEDDVNFRWGECLCSVVNPNNPDPVPGDGCRENTKYGQTCVGTFTYKGKSYSGCPTIDHHGVPWCYLEANYGNDTKWEDCAVPLQCQKPPGDTGCREETTFGTYCPKSFIFKGKTYEGCTTASHAGVPWCSLTPNYDEGQQFGNCATPLKCIDEDVTGCIEKATFGSHCANSYIYKGKSYEGCITTNNAGVPWCSLTPNFDEDDAFGNCATPLKCTMDGDGVSGCTEKTYYGADCAATYIYENQTFEGCITAKNSGVRWCSLTDNFDIGKSWANCETPLKCAVPPAGDGCVERTKSGGYCARRYIYKKETYEGCITADFGSTYWCSLTDDYDTDQQYEACATPTTCTSSSSP